MWTYTDDAMPADMTPCFVSYIDQYGVSRSCDKVVWRTDRWLSDQGVYGFLSFQWGGSVYAWIALPEPPPLLASETD